MRRNGKDTTARWALPGARPLVWWPGGAPAHVPGESEGGRERASAHSGGVQLRSVDMAPGRGPMEILGKAVLVLRPQAVNHERKRPFTALGLPRASAIVAALGRRLAKRRRPRQRQHVKIEFARRILPPVLC